MAESPKCRSLLLINQTWLAEDFHRLGIRTYSVGFGDGGFDLAYHELGVSFSEILSALPSDFHPDGLIYFDNSATSWILGLHELAIPSVFYSVDAHHHHGWHPTLAQLFDRTLVAQRDYLPFFHNQSVDAHWMPLWAPHKVEPSPNPDIDVSFRGSFSPEHVARKAFFEGLAARVTVDFGPGGYDETYSRSKIVVNHTVLGDLNFRTFEGMIAGAMMLTPAISNGFPELFQDGVDVVTYERDNIDDAAEKIRFYLAHESERRAIAEAGRQKVLALHSSECRARDFSEHLDQIVIREKPLLYVSAARSALATAAVVRKHGGATIDRFLYDAADSLERSALKDEGCSSDFVAAVFLARHCLAEAGLDDRGRELLSRVRQAYPRDVILALAHTEQLVALGDFTAALEIARSVSDSPEELLAAAARLLDDVRQRIDAEFTTWAERSVAAP